MPSQIMNPLRARTAIFALAGVGVWYAVRRNCESFDALKSMSAKHREDVARIAGAMIASLAWSRSSQHLLVCAIAADRFLDIAESVEPDETFRALWLFGAHVTFQANVYYYYSTYTCHPTYRRMLGAFSRHSDNAFAQPRNAAHHFGKLASVSAGAGARFAALSLAIKLASCAAKQRPLPPVNTLLKRAMQTALRTAIYCCCCATLVSLAGHLRVPALASVSAFSLVLAQPRSKWRSYLQLIYTHHFFSLFFGAPWRRAPPSSSGSRRALLMPLVALERGVVIS